MYERILVPIDGSPTSSRGLDEAMTMAKLTGAQLRLLHVVDAMPFIIGDEGYGSRSPTEVLERLREVGQKILQEGRTLVKDNGIAVDTVLFEDFGGRLYERVLEQVNEWHADLIVIGTHGRRGIKRALLGSDAEQVLRTAPVPVLLVRSIAASEGTTTPLSTALPAG